MRTIVSLTNCTRQHHPVRVVVGWNTNCPRGGLYSTRTGWCWCYLILFYFKHCTVTVIIINPATTVAHIAAVQVSSHRHGVNSGAENRTEERVQVAPLSHPLVLRLSSLEAVFRFIYPDATPHSPTGPSKP